MDEHTYNPIYIRYGGAKKSIFEMDAEEMQQASEPIVRRAKKQAFSKGLPIYFSKEDVVMAEFPDGRIEIVKKKARTLMADDLQKIKTDPAYSPAALLQPLTKLLPLLVILLAIAYPSTGQAGRQKTMHFKSAFGSFSMQTPVGWKQIDVQGLGSFDGQIAVGGKDTLEFEYGFWSSELHDGQLLSVASTGNKYVPAIKYEKKIDRYDAYTIIPQNANIFSARIYIDSLYANGNTVTKFNFYGNHLSKQHQRLFYQVIQTLTFEK